MGLFKGCVVVLSGLLMVGCSSSSSVTLNAGSADAVSQQRLNDAGVTPSNAISAHPIYAMPLDPAAKHDLRVMSFNLRVATAFDLWNTWDLRRGQVVGRIRSFDPDILGTQEGLGSMEDYLVKQLPDYTFFGVGRNDGKRSGEMVGVFFRSSRFTKLDGGHFWLSPTPEKPGTRAWGAWFPRMVTWVKLQPNDGTPTFYWFNTHFDAFASKARTESAKLLLSRMSFIAGNSPTVVTGDFNADADSAPYQMMIAPPATGGLMLADAFRAVNPTHARNEGTRHDFTGHKNGPRIDWILSNSAFAAVSAAIDRTRGTLGYPSDHFPMTTTLRPLAISPAAPLLASPPLAQPLAAHASAAQPALAPHVLAGSLVPIH